MKVKVSRLRDTLLMLQSAVPKKPTLSILTNVLLKDGKAIANDLGKCIIIDLPEADTECLIPAQPVLEYLKNVPGYEELVIEPVDSEIKLSWNDGLASFNTKSPDDFPPTPEMKPKSEGDVDGDILIEGLMAVLPYAATEDSRPVIHAVALTLGEKVAKFAGADGFRLASFEVPMPYPAEQIIILPLDIPPLLEKLWRKAPAPPTPAGNLVRQILGKRKITLGIDGDKVSFRFGSIIVMSMLIEGHYPDYEKLVPQSPPNKVKMLAPDFERALRHVKDIAVSGNGIVRLEWGEDTMQVSAEHYEKGNIQAKIPAVTDDGPGKIALNIKYLLEYTERKHDFFTMAITNDQSPALFTYRNSPAVVMMPMFVQWGGKEPVEASAAKEAKEEEV